MVTQFHMWVVLYQKMGRIYDQIHMESSWADPKNKEEFQYIFEGVKNQECNFLLWIGKNHIHQNKHDVLYGYKRLVWLPVEDNSCSIPLRHKISAMWSITNFLSCNAPIDDVDSYTPYFHVFVCSSWSCHRMQGTSLHNLSSVLWESRMTYW